MRKIITLILMLSVLLVGCGDKKNTDASKFKQEYESVNGQKGCCDISIDINNKIKYVEFDKLLLGLENGTHVIYLGNNQCGWCRRAIPVLIDSVNAYKGISIYYYSLKTDRENYENGKTNNYLDVVNTLAKSDFDFSDYVDYYQDGTYKLPASLIIFVKSGKIIGVHRRTVDSHLDPFEELDNQQINELKGIYDNYLQQLAQSNPVQCLGC